MLIKPTTDQFEIPYDRRLTAYHEAAHAIMFTLSGIKVKQVTAIYSSRYHGECLLMKSEVDDHQAAGNVVGLIIGDHSYAKAGGPLYITSGDEESLHNFISSEEFRKKIPQAPSTTDSMRTFVHSIVQAALDDPYIWGLIEALAVRLQVQDIIYGDEIDHMMGRTN